MSATMPSNTTAGFPRLLPRLPRAAFGCSRIRAGRCGRGRRGFSPRSAGPSNRSAVASLTSGREGGVCRCVTSRVAYSAFLWWEGAGFFGVEYEDGLHDRGGALRAAA
jgi:hypothetical protein